MIEKLKIAFYWCLLVVRWNARLPPWTRVLIRFALRRNRHFGDNDTLGNAAWSAAMKTTWDDVTAKKYAARVLTYGLN
jgi:hypothetical protein